MKLTAEQKTRLEAFLKREAAGETLNPAEAAEKDFLSGLAGDELPALLAAAKPAGLVGESGAAGEEGEPGAETAEGADSDALAHLTVGQRLSAFVAGNASLARQVATLKGQLAAAITGRQTAETALATLTAERDTLAGERDTLAGRVAALEADAKTTDKAVTDALAGLNIPRKELPKPGATGGGGDPLESLKAQMDAETDPRQKAILGNQLWEAFRARKAA